MEHIAQIPPITSNLLEPFPRSPLLPELKIVLPIGNRYLGPHDNTDTALIDIRGYMQMYNERGHSRIFLAGQASDWIHKDLIRLMLKMYGLKGVDFEQAYRMAAYLINKFPGRNLFEEIDHFDHLTKREDLEESPIWMELDHFDHAVMGIDYAVEETDISYLQKLEGILNHLNALNKKDEIIDRGERGKGRFAPVNFDINSTNVDRAKVRIATKKILDDRTVEMFKSVADYQQAIVSAIPDFQARVYSLPFGPHIEFSQSGYLAKLQAAERYVNDYGMFRDIRNGVSLYKVGEKVKEAYTTLAWKNLHGVMNAFELLIQAKKTFPDAPVIMYANNANAAIMRHLYQNNLDRENAQFTQDRLDTLNYNIKMNAYQEMLANFYLNGEIDWPKKVLYLYISTIAYGAMKIVERRMTPTVDAVHGYTKQIYEIFVPFFDEINHNMAQGRMSIKRAFEAVVDKYLSDNEIAKEYLRLWAQAVDEN